MGQTIDMQDRTLSYAVELNGELSVCTEGQLLAADNLRRIKGDCRVVSDLQGVVTRIMTIEADARYVELMISKRLQETGEFDEPVTILTHWKKKQSKNSTRIFFTALPSKRYYQYLEVVKEHKNHLLLLPLQCVLLKTLRQYCGNQPCAVVFQHDRFADIIAGTQREVWYANRVVAFDKTPEQIENLWEVIRTDIISVGEDHGHPIESIYLLTWLDRLPLPQWQDPKLPSLIPIEGETVAIPESEPISASLPVMLKATCVGSAIATGLEKACYRAKCILPFLNMLLILLAVMGVGAGFWYDYQISSLKQQVAGLQQRAATLRQSGDVSFSSVDYKSVLDFIDQLWTARSLPSYSQIFRDLSIGLGDALELKSLKADYMGSKVEIEVFGNARASFETAYKAYRELQQQLQYRGYTLQSNRFDTQINTSDFMIRFAKELK